MLFQQMKYRIMIILFICFSFTSIIRAQYQPDKKALHYQELSILHFRQGDTTNAREFAILAAEKDEHYAMPWVMIGNIDELQNKKRSAIRAYREAMQRDSIHEFKHIYYALAVLELDLCDFDAAIEDALTYISTEGIDEKDKKKAEELIRLGRFRKHQTENPVDFDPLNLGSEINTSSDEYVNAISTDDRFMYLTIKSPQKNDTAKQLFYENIFLSKKDSTGWGKPQALTFGEHYLPASGGASISPNMRYLFFTFCNYEGRNGGCDLYYSKITNGKLEESRSLGNIVNSDSWDSQPSFSSDGKTLFFASKRSGGYGGSDIWISTLNEEGRFLAPVNAGPAINTSGDEMAPLIHYDSKSLYFSSNHHLGMGGYDLFVSRKISDSAWSEPLNLGYPINTAQDEINLIVSPNGHSAYISSDKSGGYGGFDIYQFELPEIIRPEAVSYVQGSVFDHKTGEKLSAVIQLKLNETNEVFTTSQSDENGMFLIVLPAGKSMAMSVNKPGYLFYSQHFDTELTENEFTPLHLEVPLKKIEVGEHIILKNIFFETDQYALLESSFSELNTLVELLISNPAIKIEISGHTDNVGSLEYNQILSEKRAKAVYDYLIQKHIDADRLLTVGYGKSRPLSTNETEAGRAANRRIELKIVCF